jgi:hypothetical protein
MDAFSILKIQAQQSCIRLKHLIWKIQIEIAASKNKIKPVYKIEGAQFF